MRDNEKPLKLITEFNKQTANDQFGYQKVDDTTVLERKRIPINAYSDSDGLPWGVWISVYDFKSQQILTYVQNAFTVEARTPSMTLKNFSEIEGKQAIIDAHRALTELKGTPPPLEEITCLTRLDKHRPRIPGI